MKYTIEDVAKKAGVSITTVSRVMNGNYPVKKETREKVEAVISQLNYKPNPLAKGLINKKTNTIGVIVPGITNMFFTEVVSGIENYSAGYGYNVVISDSKGSADMEKDKADNFVSRLFDGIILLDAQTENMKNGFIESLTKEIPVICVNGYHNNIEANFVISGEEEGTRKALEYLSECGHKKIALLRGEKSYSYDLKEKLYRQHMRKIRQKPLIINTEGGNSINAVENAADSIVKLASSGIRLGEDITAILACNDLMGIGALNGCNRLNVAVPDEISIIGFDNIPLTQMIHPKLTTVDQNMQKLGGEAAKNVIELIESGSFRCGMKTIKTELILRETCKKL